MEGLLQYLADNLASDWNEPRQWQHWCICRIYGGLNNILYHVTNEDSDLAVKFTIRDGRRRAWREFHALRALQEAGLLIAPQPVHLDETTYILPVVVQTWVAGTITAVPPQTENDWDHLLAHYAAIQTIRPGVCTGLLDKAVVNFASIACARQAIQTQLSLVPDTARPPSLLHVIQLVDRFAAVYPELPPTHTALCRSDPNSLNFVRNAKGWISVDWEYSGWGDPCFEMADLLTHPCYLTIPVSQRQWVAARYAQFVENETAVARIETYYPLMLAWWVVRMARRLYEVPLGRDQRLVQHPDNWQAQGEANYERYVALASIALNEKCPTR